MEWTTVLGLVVLFAPFVAAAVWALYLDWRGALFGLGVYAAIAIWFFGSLALLTA